MTSVTSTEGVGNETLALSRRGQLAIAWRVSILTTPNLANLQFIPRKTLSNHMWGQKWLCSLVVPQPHLLLTSSKVDNLIQASSNVLC